MRRLPGIALVLALAGAAMAGCGDIAPLPSPSSEPDPTLGGGPPGDNSTGGGFEDMTPAAVPEVDDTADDVDAPDATAPDASAPDVEDAPDAQDGSSSDGS